MSRFVNNALQGVGLGLGLENKERSKALSTPLLELLDISLNNTKEGGEREVEGKKKQWSASFLELKTKYRLDWLGESLYSSEKKATCYCNKCWYGYRPLWWLHPYTVTHTTIPCVQLGIMKGLRMHIGLVKEQVSPVKH